MGTFRLLLAISVVTSHCGPLFNFTGFIGGSLSVQCFFMISGFYMALILSSKYNKISGGFKLFLTNRLLRLYPLYWTILLLTAIFFVLLGMNKSAIPVLEYYSFCNISSFIFIVFSEIFIFFQDVILFLFMDMDTGDLHFTSNFKEHFPALHKFMLVPQSWSLGIELTFYLIAPSIIRKSNSTLVLVLIASLLLRIYFFYFLNLQNDPWTYRFFLTEIFFFVLGVFAYRIYESKISKTTISNQKKITFITIIIICTSLYPFLPELKLSALSFSLKDMIYVLIVFTILPFLFHLFKQSKIDNAIGELSFPIYISHILVMLVLSVFLPKTSQTGTLVIVSSIVFSLILNRFITRPIEKIRAQRVQRKMTISSNHE